MGCLCLNWVRFRERQTDIQKETCRQADRQIDRQTHREKLTRESMWPPKESLLPLLMHRCPFPLSRLWCWKWTLSLHAQLAAILALSHAQPNLGRFFLFCFVLFILFFCLFEWSCELSCGDSMLSDSPKEELNPAAGRLLSLAFTSCLVSWWCDTVSHVALAVLAVPI